MVKSQTVSISPAEHADKHRHGGSDPLTGDVRIDIDTGDTPGTQVFSGASPTAWDDLDLSAVVGAKKCFVTLLVDTTNATGRFAAFRSKGSTDDNYEAANSGGISNCTYGGGHRYRTIMVLTDAAGICRWKVSSAAGTTTIDVLHFMTVG